MNLQDKTIAIIGLGYVDLPLAVEFGKVRPVIGFDIDHCIGVPPYYLTHKAWPWSSPQTAPAF